jgi:hypothetical protein
MLLGRWFNTHMIVQAQITQPLRFITAKLLASLIPDSHRREGMFSTNKHRSRTATSRKGNLDSLHTHDTHDFPFFHLCTSSSKCHKQARSVQPSKYNPRTESLASRLEKVSVILSTDDKVYLRIGTASFGIWSSWKLDVRRTEPCPAWLQRRHDHTQTSIPLLSVSQAIGCATEKERQSFIAGLLSVSLYILHRRTTSSGRYGVRPDSRGTSMSCGSAAFLLASCWSQAGSSS